MKLYWYPYSLLSGLILLDLNGRRVRVCENSTANMDIFPGDLFSLQGKIYAAYIPLFFQDSE